jgi:predicted dehydrogenase
MTLRFIHVGMGGWGRDWAKNAIPRAGAVEPVAWVDADPIALRTAQKEIGIPAKRCFPTLAAAVVEVDAEAVLITAQVGGHVPVAMEALAAGKHVLVEKPFAPSVAEARRAVEEAEERSLVLAVSQNYRFFPAPRAVAGLIAEGELGPVGALAIDFRRHVTAETGSARHFALTQPLLVDMAIHHFDLMRMILRQNPTLVSCQTWNPLWSPFAEPAAGAATVVFDGGAVASWRGSWVSPGESTIWAGEWRVECERGEIRWTSREERGGTGGDRVTVRPIGKPAREMKLPPVEPHGRAGALAAFAAAVQSGNQPETSGRDNLSSLAIVEAAVASAATGRAEPVRVA